MFIYKCISPKIVILSFFMVLTSCGGGGGGSTPPPPATDKTPPEIIATNPGSEQLEINTRAFIEVTFNEAIVDVDTNQIDIFPYDANGVSNTRLKLRADPFAYDPKTKTLTIKPEINALLANTKYQVTVSGIKDIAGNKMVGSCQWDFGTTGLKDFGIGKTGVCGTFPTAPGKPGKLVAVAGSGSVTLSWSAPTSGTEVSYYTIARSPDNSNNFTLLQDNISATSLNYTDVTAQNGTLYYYRITASNAANVASAGVTSNPVTPAIIDVTTLPGAVQNVSAVAGDGSVTISWSAPITGDSVASYQIEKAVNGAAFSFVKEVPAAVLRYVDTKATNNNSHVYRISARNAIGLGPIVLSSAVTPKAAGIPGQAITELISQSPGTDNRFGQQMAYSADGTTLVIGEPFGDPASAVDSGTVQIFTKTNGVWQFSQLLNAQTPVSNAGFGWSVAISPDGSALAIGQITYYQVDIYTKSATPGIGWVYSKTIVPDTSSGTAIGNFGTSVAFHSSSTLLAIGAYGSAPNGKNGAGVVQLFTKSSNSWIFAKELTATTPVASNQFGSHVIFSPDGTTLAISEQYGDPSTTVADAGVVHLFAGSGSSWSFSQKLVSNAPVTNGFFGGFGATSAVSFSLDSKTIAVGEQGANTVQLFTSTGINWIRQPVISLANGVGGVAFSADGTTLAVGEPGAENVYLLTQSGSNWVVNRTLTAQVPAVSNFFGYSVFFSPIGNELAIFEYNGDTTAAIDAGVVTIIDISQLP